MLKWPCRAPTASSWQALALLLVPAAAVAGACPAAIYQGFDSRLSVEVVAFLPAPEPKTAEFAVRQGWPIVLSERRILVSGVQGWAATPLVEGVRGLVVSADGGVRVTTPSRRVDLGNGPRVETAEVNAALLQRTGRRAGPRQVELLEQDGRFVLDAVDGRGQRVRVAALPAKPVAVGWNATGLSFVLDGVVWAWRADERRMRSLAGDAGFARARSSCLLANGNVVVGLPSSTFVVSEGHALAIAGVGTLCDVEGGRLSLLDPRRGVVWRVDGIERVGIAELDMDHARRLVDGRAVAGRPAAARNAEAARLVGCSMVEQWAASGKATDTAASEPALR